MGVRGLTTYIANRSDEYLQSYELSNTYLVLDGNSICSQMYRLHAKCNDCFGGDYDKYANKVYTFFENLSICGVTPIVIFDGGYEKRKLRTVLDRMQSKLNSAHHINSVTEGSYSHFPLLLREEFKDIVLKLNIKCVRCNFEGDGVIAYVAKALNCPVLSYDSDFFIFNALYIPFPTLNFNPNVRYNKKLKKQEYFMQCSIYNIENFLNSFGGMEPGNLPLLSVLLGNDYIKSSEFAAFYSQLKLQKGRNLHNDQQRRIKTIIAWLKHETFSSAYKKILSRFKTSQRKALVSKMNEALRAYSCSDSEILQYLELDAQLITQHSNTPLVEDIDNCNDDGDISNIELTESNISTSESDSSDDDDISDSFVLPCDEHEDDDSLPKYFLEKFRSCIYPSCFMDILKLNCYYCIPQVESPSKPSSHCICFDILSVIHRILRGSDSAPLTVYTRGENFSMKKYILNACRLDIPNMSDIENLKTEEAASILLKIVQIDSDIIKNCLSQLPNNWHLFLISLHYWTRHSEVKTSIIYSLLMCAIVLTFVDKEIGFYRSYKSFYSEYKSKINEFSNGNSKTISSSPPSENICTLSGNINFRDSLLCMREVIKYFQMDIKMKTNIKLYDKTLVHNLCEFQSCFLHIKYLNYLLNLPFADCNISSVFDGTFAYNMVSDLDKRTDINIHVDTLFSGCASVLSLFRSVLKLNMGLITDKLVVIKHSRRRRRKKKVPLIDNNEVVDVGDSPGEEHFEDSNNRFALLSISDR